VSRRTGGWDIFVCGVDFGHTRRKLTSCAFSRLSDKRLHLKPMALHSGLTMAEQMEVFEASPSDARKVVVATNIAEVSPHPFTTIRS
jgi:hypothetical protein